MRYYIECSYEEKEEVKKLGASWDWEKRKWYYTNEADKPKFAKWIIGEIKKQLPDLSSKFNEKIENGKNKYFLQMGKRGKVIVEECIDSKNGDIKCYDYPLKKEWLCNDGCSTFEDEFDRLYPEEVYDAMSDDEIEKAGDDIIEKCRLKNCNNCDCESCNGVCDGNINEYISILPTISYGSQLIYLGQFISLTECRNYLSDFSL